MPCQYLLRKLRRSLKQSRQTCELRVLSVRGVGGSTGCKGDAHSCCGGGCCECVQLGGVRLFDQSGMPLKVDSVSNPHGKSPGAETPANVVDGTRPDPLGDFEVKV